MSAAIRNRVRRGHYLDSVALMRLSVAVGEAPGVQEAVLMTGSEANLEIMRAAGLLAPEGADAGADDLVIAVRADDDDTAEAALERAEVALAGASAGGGGGGARQRRRPRTLPAAMTALPGANLALISTPGEFAAREARAAMARGLNVMIFSDNVPLEEERALKHMARELGVLLMGPDCGTAYLAGTPLAFANRVAPGRVGVIAASGTGLQEFAVLCHRGGCGIRHGIGVGGRDLDDAVGGLATLAALELLVEDPEVERLVLIAKPPGPDTARRVFQALADCGKPVAVCAFGVDAQDLPAGLRHASTLKQAASWACDGAAGCDEVPGDAAALAQGIPAGRHALRGLYSGGTLCTEAQAVLAARGIRVRSNAPLPGSVEVGVEVEHELLDLGADEYTLGRPHPMIEPAVRSAPLEAALADARVAVVLLDVVLGLGSHPDPCAEIVRCVSGAPAARPCVIASVCGTELDPQGFSAQVERLVAVGVTVVACNADAAGLAAAVLEALPD